MIFREPSTWDRYRNYIIGGVALLIVQALLIIGLLWQRAKKKKVERSLRERLAFEQMVSQLSTAFVNLPEDQGDVKIAASLARIGEFLRMDRITAREFSREEESLTVVASWRAEGTQPAPDVLNIEQFPWWAPQIREGELALVSDLGSLPEGASVEREYLRKIGAVSAAMVPLKVGDELFGCISFVSASRRIVWTEDLVNQLKILAEIFSNALTRKRAQEARFKHAAIVESSDDAMILRNLEGRILSWNEAAARIFGFTQADAIGQPVTIIIPRGLRDEVDEFLKRIKTGERIEHYETVRQTKEARHIDVSLTISPLRDASGRIMAISEIARDITDRKRAEQTLRESEQRFRQVANTSRRSSSGCRESTSCALFSIRPGWISLGNRWNTKLETVGPRRYIRYDFERCLRIYSEAFDARMDFEMEYRLKRYDGEYRWIVDIGVPRTESDGAFVGYIGSCIDITDRKFVEASLEGLSGRLIAAQEEERTRIARELHDDFSQRLALLGIDLSRLWKKRPESEDEQRIVVRQLWNRTKEISTDVHRLSHQLHSSKLEHIGLAPV